ncbi:GNAT family N-acetyltransferase [Nitrosopumilus sp.]|uniref:GNAT family N-acetyltransferase n=1 Tax=Nitrosopumilus sp. TaxID=2024843 RepID=UPI0026395B63|nr:GNAT family N-acetyltransferase [Nitrosopumilus sp.]
MIRKAIDSDKETILKFCQNTFSWGDYIEYVWDYWLKEDNLLVFENPSPVGICHALTSRNQLWIEGIRVSPNHRRKKIASELISYSEKIGLENKITTSFMLIDTSNTASLNLAISLGYTIVETWKFYSLLPKTISNIPIQFENTIDSKLYPMYIDSWRWFPLDNSSIEKLSTENRIISSPISNNFSLSILTESEHFDNTLIATLFSKNHESTSNILSYLQNLGMDRKFERIQILTKEELPNHEGLEHKLTFHLLKKSLV